jgi:hypothetical protein
MPLALMHPDKNKTQEQTNRQVSLFMASLHSEEVRSNGKHIPPRLLAGGTIVLFVVNALKASIGSIWSKLRRGPPKVPIILGKRSPIEHNRHNLPASQDAEIEARPNF